MADEQRGRMPKVCLGLPNTGQIEMETAHCLMAMNNYMISKYHGTGFDICLITIDGTIIPQSRIGIVQQALQMNATHVLWIDSDMTFPKTTMERLLSHRLPVVGANYSQRKRPCKPTASNMDDNWIYDEGQAGLEEVKFFGHGVCLVETAVYEAMHQPWYMNAWIERADGSGHVMGEDVWFFRELKAQLDVDPVIDHDLSRQVSHIGKHHYTMSDAGDDRAKVHAMQAEGKDTSRDTTMEELESA